jgi:hypothetical protein
MTVYVVVEWLLYEWGTPKLHGRFRVENEAIRTMERLQREAGKSDQTFDIVESDVIGP